jgi:O-antigen ligase
MNITPNVGPADRAIRIVVGLALIALALTGAIGVWGWVGVVPLAAGIVRYCPVYTLIGVNTCKSA